MNDHKQESALFLKELCRKYSVTYKGEKDTQLEERIFNIHKPDCDSIRNIRWEYCRNEILYACRWICFWAYLNPKDLSECFSNKPEDRELLTKMLFKEKSGLLVCFINWMLSCFNDDKKEDQLKELKQSIDTYCDNRSEANLKNVLGNYLVSELDYDEAKQ